MDSDRQDDNNTEEVDVSLPLWWSTTTKADFKLYQEKAKEYGSLDLSIIGSTLDSLLANREGGSAIGVELGIAFYLHGKIARAFSAYKAGQLPSEDTLKDLRVYAMMLSAARAGYIP